MQTTFMGTVRKKYLSVNERNAYHRLEDVIGCKWSAGVVAAVDEGIFRPGGLQRYIPGISKKILNERLRKLVNFEVLRREEITSESMPHVEYRLTAKGRKLAAIIRLIRDLND